MRIPLLAVFLLGCAHERESAAKVLACPAEQVGLVASAEQRVYEKPRETAAGQAAMAGVGAAVGALAAMVGGGAASAAFFLPAGATQLAAPGWRHYEGCGKALVCFDGGFCLRGEELAAARAVPGLMQRSVAELGGKLEPQGECVETQAYADRRGIALWTLSRCSASFGCKVNEASYTCSDEKGRAVER